MRKPRRTFRKSPESTDKELLKLIALQLSEIQRSLNGIKIQLDLDRKIDEGIKSMSEIIKKAKEGSHE